MQDSKELPEIRKNFMDAPDGVYYTMCLCDIKEFTVMDEETKVRITYWR